MNSNVRKCPFCGKIFFEIEGQEECPFCKKSLKDDPLKKLADLFGINNPFNDNFKMS